MWLLKLNKELLCAVERLRVVWDRRTSNRNTQKSEKKKTPHACSVVEFQPPTPTKSQGNIRVSTQSLKRVVSHLLMVKFLSGTSVTVAMINTGIVKRSRYKTEKLSVSVRQLWLS